MGVDAGDFDNDGDEDLFIGELASQGADLYVNDGTGVFSDDSARAGIRLASLPSTTFGAAWLDYDNDGWLDLLVVNGAVTHTVEALAKGEKFKLQQRKQLFHNLANGRFDDVSGQAGALFQTLDVGRGDDEEHASSIGQLRIANIAKKMVNRHSGVGQMTRSITSARLLSARKTKQMLLQRSIPVPFCR